MISIASGGARLQRTIGSRRARAARVDGGQDWALEHRDLLRAFATLPEEQRSVVLLIGVEDLSYEQAARMLGVPIGTVMSRLSRGCEWLRHYMNGNLNGAATRS